MASHDKANFREDVATAFLEKIEQGAAPWQKPWTGGIISDGPVNAVTGKAYSGINNFWLGLAEHEDPRWLTFRQAQSLEAKVRKGEKGRLVEYWQWRDERVVRDADGKPLRDEDGKTRKQSYQLERPKLFFAVVFNGEQVDGLEAYKAPEPDFEPHKRAEDILKGSGVRLLNDQADRAFYNPDSDQIHLPAQAAFKTAYDYYGTAMHELGHASGHESRMARQFAPFGTPVYAQEELRAEMASYLVCRQLGLTHDPDRHAGYVEHWLKGVHDDKNTLFRAARDAELISQWVMQPERRMELEKQGQLERQARESQKNMVEIPSASKSFGRRSKEVKAPSPDLALSSAPASTDKEHRVSFNVPGKTGHGVTILSSPGDNQIRAHYSKPGAKDYQSRAIEKSWFDKPDGKLYYNAKEDALVEYVRGDDPSKIVRHSVSFDLSEERSAAPVKSVPQKDDHPIFGKTAPEKSFERVYLAVPYAERREADALGADWDREKRSWYAATPEVVERTKKWSVDGKAPALQEKRDPQREFSDWLRVQGVELAGQAEMDGKWHRVRMKGDKDKSGSYRGFLDGAVPNGMVHNFRGTQEKWVFTGQQLSKDEIAKALEANRQARQEREKERLQDQQKAAKTAYGIWVNLKEWARPDNCDYLKRKNVSGHGVKLDKDGRMVVPLRDTDLRIHSLQFVGDEKQYLKNGRKEGLFHAIDPGKLLQGKKPLSKEHIFILTEGYATGGTLHKHLNKPTIVAFDGDNLVKVARAIREKFPDVTLLFGADDDHHLTLREEPLPNKGQETARAAAKAVGGYVITPPFKREENAREMSDWNDFARSRGGEETKSVLSKVLWEAFHGERAREKQHELMSQKNTTKEMEVA